MKKIYVIIVNWNGWRDTLECIESVFRSNHRDICVIVCDNGSIDDSMTRIRDWAGGRLDILAERNDLRPFSFPPVKKPILYAEYEHTGIEWKGDSNDEVRLVLISNGSNLGFAGANNIGLRYAMVRDDFDYIWLLNNDTIVKPDALSEMIERMEEKPDVGICGSTLLRYYQPDKVQALGGGYYCKWIGLPWHLGRFKKSSDPIDVENVEAWMNYVVGASMLVSKRFLQEIGLLCEDYFLYFEETDWTVRARGRFGMAYAPRSVVYHKIGKSIGTSSNPKGKSFICDFYNIRNRLYFTRRHFPFALPSIYLVLFGSILVRAFLGRWDRVAMILKLMVGYTDVHLHITQYSNGRS